MTTWKYAFFLVLATFCNSALAVPMACDTGIEANVSGSTGCQLGSTNNDFLNPLQVNVDEMFGFDDWIFGQKGFDSDMDIDLGLSLTGDTISGTWTIDNIWSMYSNVMIVIKGGAGNNSVSTYVGYLLGSGDVTGDFLSPFANPNNGNLKDISHISIYVRGSAVTVAEPSVLLLLGIGFGAAAFGARRHRNV